MRALVINRSPARFLTARVLKDHLTDKAVESGPLSLKDVDAPQLPSPEWVRLRPLLAGICGSDVATVFFSSSRYFEALTSLPFTPGHEIVGERIDRPGERFVVEPALTCAIRGLAPCRFCASGQTQLCESIAIGDLKEGMQLGYCASTGGGWSNEFIAHDRSLHAVPDALTLEDAVMIEPLACAVHVSLRPTVRRGHLAIIGAGTVGLATLAASSVLGEYDSITVVAKHPIQQLLAKTLGATQVIGTDELVGVARRLHSSQRVGRYLSNGFDTVIDAVGSGASIESAIETVQPGGEVVVAGMPPRQSLDLAPLWHREVTIKGAYAYGTEHLDANTAARIKIPTENRDIRTFTIALHLAEQLRLGRLVTHRYRLNEYVPALRKAYHGGREDAIKVVFDLTKRKSVHDA
ncbi:MAG: zinc-dependent alcohol dehydrogenase [Ferrimicrobium sp.]|jgi:threonine dehydrogenase-like Zn-dependent dehydrogenase|uniref:Zinc-binding dehydrogenase n=1 Tax=Ferrimicrobium acidiphilum TaxID=121039 RepID=A0ABV3Y2G7_9ACTN|nr:zinc-binding dehydrogenase [Ferrimicrobium sp.]